MWFWLALFIIGTIVMTVRVLLGVLGDKPMPFSCPACYFGGDEDLAGQSWTWYVVRRDRVRCRRCHTWFKEHPNGMLVEDHSS
jgi:hypothetical protein